MLAGLGTDIVSIARFENISEHFMERCYTADEREYLKGRRANSIAGLFAAKEAVVKALGTGFRGFWPCDVEITHGENGEPAVVLHGGAREAFIKKHLSAIWLSISHDENTAVAFAAAERSEP